MYKLRDYQQRCHDDIMDYLERGGKSGIIVAPTAYGKSLSIANVAKEYKGGVLILSPNKEVLQQNYEKFIGYGGEACIYSASMKSKEMCHTTFATLASIKKMGKEFKAFGVSLLCIDEGHLFSNPNSGMMKQFIDDLAPKHILTWTASPFRLKTSTDPAGMKYSQLSMMNRTRPRLFKDIVHVTQIRELVDKGYWPPIDIIEREFNPLGLVLNSVGSDYTEESIKTVNQNNNVNNKIYLDIKRLLSEGAPSILVFMDSVHNCYIMKHALGEDAEVVEASTNLKDRERIIEDFKAGKIKVVLNVSTLTTGFDYPNLRYVIMGRPTGSLSVMYQIFGRLVRPYEGKTGTFIDYGDNIKRFGDPRDLTIEDFPTYGWGVFSGDRLLTGKPMDGPDVTKEDLLIIKTTKFKPGNKKFFEFGANKYKFPKDVPISYLKWAVENAQSNMSEALYTECKKIIATQK